MAQLVLVRAVTFWQNWWEGAIEHILALVVTGQLCEYCVGWGGGYMQEAQADNSFDLCFLSLEEEVCFHVCQKHCSDLAAAAQRLSSGIGIPGGIHGLGCKVHGWHIRLLLVR